MLLPLQVGCSKLESKMRPVFGNSIQYYGCSVKRKHANGLKRQTPPPNATTNGGDASRVGKIFSYYLVAFVFPSLLRPDAGRVAPISGSVWW